MVVVLNFLSCALSCELRVPNGWRTLNCYSNLRANQKKRNILGCKLLLVLQSSIF